MTSLAIKAEHLAKRYKVVVGRQHDTLREHLADKFMSLLRWSGRSSTTDSSDPETFWALKDVSIDIKEGETVGIIGRNGAGKSTLLKILSRITEPTGGRARVYGRIGSLLEVGTGFHHELSGRENLYLSGAILGMKKAEIDRKFDDIVAFAEIEKFIETPVKHYSSGMYVRLAFAVAAHLEPDILLIDEVLSVGDLAFQTKCIDHANRLRCSGATVLFVSHNMFSIKSMCSRVIYLSGGRVRFDGQPDDGIAMYEKENRLSTASWAQFELEDSDPSQITQITEIDILDEDGRSRRVFDYGERIRIRLRYEMLTELICPNFSVSIFRSDNVACCNFNAAMDGFLIPSASGTGCVELLTPPVKLVAAQYSTQVIVRHAESQQLYAAQVGESFHVRHHSLNSHYGVFHEPAVWSWKRTCSGVPDASDQEGLNKHD